MAIKKDTNSLKFISGRGDVSANVAKSDADILNQEAEVMATLAEGVGSKVVYATGVDSPFHTGRGAGRGEA